MGKLDDQMAKGVQAVTGIGIGAVAVCVIGWSIWNIFIADESYEPRGITSSPIFEFNNDVVVGEEADALIEEEMKAWDRETDPRSFAEWISQEFDFNRSPDWAYNHLNSVLKAENALPHDVDLRAPDGSPKSMFVMPNFSRELIQVVVVEEADDTIVLAWDFESDSWGMSLIREVSNKSAGKKYLEVDSVIDQSAATNRLLAIEGLDVVASGSGEAEDLPGLEWNSRDDRRPFLKWLAEGYEFVGDERWALNRMLIMYDEKFDPSPDLKLSYRPMSTIGLSSLDTPWVDRSKEEIDFHYYTPLVLNTQVFQFEIGTDVAFIVPDYAVKKWGVVFLRDKYHERSGRAYIEVEPVRTRSHAINLLNRIPDWQDFDPESQENQVIR